MFLHLEVAYQTKSRADPWRQGIAAAAAALFDCSSDTRTSIGDHSGDRAHQADPLLPLRRQGSKNVHYASVYHDLGYPTTDPGRPAAWCHRADSGRGRRRLHAHRHARGMCRYSLGSIATARYSIRGPYALHKTSLRTVTMISSPRGTSALQPRLVVFAPLWMSNRAYQRYLPEEGPRADELAKR